MKSIGKSFLRVMLLVLAVIGTLSVLEAVIPYNSPDIEVTTGVTQTDVYGTEYAIVEYDGVGILAVKALTGDDGEIHVLTCFQKPDVESSRCWSKRVDEVE